MRGLSEKDKQYFKEVREIEKEYLKLIRNFDISFPTPLNLQEQKKLFFKAIADDKFYNPQMKFEKREFDEKKVKEFKKFKVDTRNDLYGFKKLYKIKLKAEYNRVIMIKSWGTKVSCKYALKYYNRATRMTLSRAKNYCRNFKREIVRFKTLKPKEVEKRLQEEVHRLTGNKLEFKYESMAAKVHINARGGILRIDPDNRFTTLDVKRLKVHEIGVHYMRYFNGHKFGLRILETGVAGYVETEEGLAAYAEELKGVSSKAQMFIYAGRVIATHYAQKHSFYEVFQELKKYGFRDEEAFAITYRAKRCLCDMSEKGAFTKDYVYFSGYHKVKKYDKLYELEDLFIGKIKISDLKVLKKFIRKHRDNIVTIFD